MADTDADRRKLFVAFRCQCVWAHDCFYTYTSLYESGAEPRAVLHAAASRFFRDLNLILIEYVMLQICKITDPPESAGHKNLTLNHLNVELRTARLMTDEIEQFSNGLMTYRRSIVAARNKLISHLDRDTVLNALDIGAHTKRDVEAFFANLYGYTEAVGNAVGEGPLDYRGGGPGDVLDLIAVLRRAENPLSP
jgi:hypothetical protein